MTQSGSSLSEADILLQSQRVLLKLSLVSTRTVWTRTGLKPQCGICGAPIEKSAPDMHEVIITRREARGANVMPQIMVRENCTLVHQRCHLRANRFRGGAIERLIHEEGKDAIIEWLESLRPYYKTGIVDEKISLVESCDDQEG